MLNGIASLASLFEEKRIVDAKQMREGINYLVYHKTLAESLNFFFNLLLSSKPVKRFIAVFIVYILGKMFQIAEEMKTER